MEFSLKNVSLKRDLGVWVGLMDFTYTNCNQAPWLLTFSC